MKSLCCFWKFSGTVFSHVISMLTTTVSGVFPNCSSTAPQTKTSTLLIICLSTSWTNMINEAKFREILLPSWDNLNDYVLHIFILFSEVHCWKTFFHHNSLHQNIKFTMKEEINGELAFLDTLLKRNNGKISVMVYKKPTHTDQYLCYNSHHQTSKENFVSSLFNKAYSIFTS